MRGDDRVGNDDGHPSPLPSMGFLAADLPISMPAPVNLDLARSAFTLSHHEHSLGSFSASYWHAIDWRPAPAARNGIEAVQGTI